MPGFVGHVESIPATNEAIFACSEGVGGMALLHLKLFVARNSADVTVKASSKDAANKLSSSVCAVLSSSV